MDQPETRYARSGDLAVAYQVIGDAPEDLVLAPGFLSHVELAWEEPSLRRFLLRLASFRRLIVFDERGTGLSDPTPRAPTLEERAADLEAVMDAAGSSRADLLGVSEGGAMALMFAATRPQRTSALVLYGAWPRLARAADFPEGIDPADIERLQATVAAWGSGVGLSAWAPSRAHDDRLRSWFGRLQRSGASPGMARQLFAPTRTSTPAACCRRSTRRRSSCTDAPIGWFRRPSAATWRTTCRMPGTSSSTVRTTSSSSGTPT